MWKGKIRVTISKRLELVKSKYTAIHRLAEQFFGATSFTQRGFGGISAYLVQNINFKAPILNWSMKNAMEQFNVEISSQSHSCTNSGAVDVVLIDQYVYSNSD